MTLQEQIPLQHRPEELASIATKATGETETDDAQGYRTGGYQLLAALLRSIPDQSLLDHVTTLAEVDSESDALGRALAELGQAAKRGSINAVNDEYHALFIGLGRGELVPFASWYLTGFLMEKPLGNLRDDLVSLGFERQTDIREPEDHIAALCEVMAMLISEGCEAESDKNSDDVQRHFFQTHMEPWVTRFF